MATPLITLAAIVAVALIYVVAPIVAEAFVRFRGRLTVRCPETNLAAEVQLDARRAALTAVPGPSELRVTECSLWPEHAGCDQKCVEHIGASA